jgi:hypothetical protein
MNFPFEMMGEYFIKKVINSVMMLKDEYDYFGFFGPT